MFIGRVLRLTGSGSSDDGDQGFLDGGGKLAQEEGGVGRVSSFAS